MGLIQHGKALRMSLVCISMRACILMYKDIHMHNFHDSIVNLVHTKKLVCSN